MRTDSRKPFAFDAGFRVASGGRVAAKGQATADGRSADATLTVSRFALAAAQPYVAAVAAVVLRAGDVSTTGRLSYRGGGDRPAVRYAGAVDVNGVRVVEEATGEPVLGWTSLRAAPLRFGLAPDRSTASARLAPSGSSIGLPFSSILIGPPPWRVRCLLPYARQRANARRDRPPFLR